MGETGYSPNEANDTVDRFGLSKERRLETVDTNIDLLLRRCQRKGIQPREMVLKGFHDRQKMNEQLGDDLAADIYASVTGLPDYNLDDEIARAQAYQDIQRIFSRIIDFQHSNAAESRVQREQERQAQEHWKQAGVFSYEIGRQNELVLHVPSMTEPPQPGQLKDSLRQLADTLEQEPDIKEVRGSSLLLEHPIARRLGFEIDPGSDEEFVPNFRMSREEFLKRFGKT
ncbi:MAG: hypothetical protein A2898_01995 [Candidatus Kerfeldbacteria bacterium RIFCSPLOWO2_01_FULL_48_11]|uniref:Uncharacterized protein n=1 Tax=Candidatus Kerfeldbacteria bacterium RIFCSPLOWO2_01_FULL_48_11 TaxID=1798543 RepID=A0A1G2B705_9BACT|nr:MAG: hypothetical protein A2898_01995 [Candidatus Kerfeldbacteria bacterium RIFCSPLOWO2_01_FULL_48_11]